jgi:MFS family permease
MPLKEKKARYGMFPPLGAPIGFILSNGLFLVLGLALSDTDFRDWGWRLPFLASAVLVGVGLWIRLKLTETPEFAAALAKAPPPRVPFAHAFRYNRLPLFAGTIAATAAFAVFYIATAFSLGYGTTKLGIGREEFLTIQLVSILFMGVGIIASGYWSDKFSPIKVMGLGCVLILAFSFLTAPWLGSGVTSLTGAYLCCLLFLLGLIYGPLGAWLPALFPTNVRYTGVSICFNAAGILGGALTPNIALELSQSGLEWVGYYMGLVCVFSLIGLFMLRGRTWSN